MSIVDVVIHVDETIDHDRRIGIADTVRAHEGVAVSPTTTKNRI